MTTIHTAKQQYTRLSLGQLHRKNGNYSTIQNPACCIDICQTIPVSILAVNVRTVGSVSTLLFAEALKLPANVWHPNFNYSSYNTENTYEFRDKIDKQVVKVAQQVCTVQNSIS